MKFRILIATLLCSVFSWGQINENIQTWTNHVSYGTWTQAISAGTVNMTQCIVANAAAATGTASAGRVQMNASSGIIELPTLSSVGTVEVRLAAGAAGRTLKLQSYDGSTWQDVTTFSSIGTTGATFTYAMSSTSATTLRLSSPSAAVYVHDIIISLNTPTPTITLTPTTLSSFTYVVGSGPSAQQSFTASGTNLTGDITLAAPTNYEISETSGSGFTNSITLTPSSGSVAATTIYVRLKTGLTVASYNENVTATSSSASNKTVACTGSVTSSVNSDLIVVSGSEAGSISSLINNASPLTSSTGVQVLQFKVRDGGASLNDVDTLPTILNAITIAQQGTNGVSTWTDAINTIALFDGTTYIANGTVSATSIVFSGLTLSVTDNTEKTLSLRLSLKCPLGADAFDGEDFGFSISNANTTFSAAGSGKASFSAVVNPNGTNVISVVATQFSFTIQPSITGLNATMSPSVKVKAIDFCGNLDSDFTSSVSLTSTGTMTGSPLSVSTVAGIATFSNIVHSVIGTGLTVTAVATGLTSLASSTFNITDSTVFKPGELVFVGFDGQIFGSGADDEFLIATMVDIKPGTQFSIVNSRYEAGAAGNVRTNKWGGGGDFAEEEPYVATITYNGVTNISAGSILQFRTDGSTTWFGSINVITGTTSTTRTSEFSGSQLSFAPNIAIGGTDADQLYLIQGSFTSDGNIDTGQANYYLNGTLLHGLTNRVAWVALTSACSGATTGGSTRQSRLPAALTCFNVESTATNSISGFYENDKQHGLATQRQIILAIANLASNWTLGSGRYTLDATSSLTTRAGKTFVIGTGNSAGQWVGDTDTNWFNCSNWEGLKVPDSDTDVVINTSATRDAIIDYTATYSDYYLDTAATKNLTISGRKVQAQANANNILEVYGNLSISGTGSLDMDDGNSGTADGIVKLYGNWTNSVANSAFEEGNGTVQLEGSTTQIINSNLHTNPEQFYNVVLNNNFTTSVSNNLIASGNLEVKAGKTLTISSDDFVRINNKLTNNGNLSIANNGQLLQVEETDTNDGDYSGTKFQMQRIAQVKNFDYVYWSSPTENFPLTSLPTNNRYEWDATHANTNGTIGNWVTVTTPTMSRSKGYIARASNGAATPQALPVTFTGKPFNGTSTTVINRGNYDGIDYDAEPSNPNNVWTTKYDDNWNLVGNPYPSAIDAEEFLQLNQTKIRGSLWVWKHGLDPSSSIDPFYDNFGYNYSSNDYIKFNGLGSTEPDTFDGQIAAGQGFLVNMLHTTATPNTISFTNGLRTDASLNAYDNTDFFKTNNYTVNTSEEKHRIWLDIMNTTLGQLDRTLVGYSANSSYGFDHLYDCVYVPRGEISLFSLAGNDPFSIQGRALPFDNNDIIPMGIKIVSAGNHKIAIKKVDGLFTTNQDIYLEDTALNIIHDLRQSPYEFTSEVGVITNRFKLRYTTSSLGNTEFASEGNIMVATQSQQITIRSGTGKMIAVTIYDVLGREIASTTNVSENEIIFTNITARNQALIVKIKLDNGQIVTKKVLL